MYELISEKYSAEESMFITAVNELLDKVRAVKPGLIQKLSDKESIVIVDVGCGYFRYGCALKNVLNSINPNNEIIAVDKKRFNKDYFPAKFIKGGVNDVEDRLRVLGIHNVDIITVFNPYPGIPDLSKIRTGSTLLGCVDWNPALFQKTLQLNGFRAVAWQRNNYKEAMQAWFNNYDPFVFAQSIK